MLPIRLSHIDCFHIKLHHDSTNPPGGQSTQAMGRTRGGMNTKLDAIVDSHGRAVALGLAQLAAVLTGSLIAFKMTP